MSNMIIGTYSEQKGNLQLRIESKKLHSGKCQVKFYVAREGLNNLYGYTLVEPHQTLKEVVYELRKKLARINGYESFYQSNLFSIRKNSRNFDGNFMIFKN